MGARDATRGSTDSIASGSAPLFWAQIGGNTALFVAVLLLARGLGPEGRGTIAFITVAALITAWVMRFGIGEATIVFAAERPSARPVLLANVLLSAAVGGLGGALVVCAGLLLFEDLRPPGIGDVELALLGISVVAATFAHAGYKFFLACRRFRAHAAVTVSTSWVYALLLACVWLALGLTVVYAAVLWIATHAVRALVLFASARRDVGLARPNLPLLRESMTFGLRAWVGTVADDLNFRIDQILIAVIASETALGVYAVAVNVSELLLYLPGATAAALLPLVAGGGRDERVDRTLHAFRSVAFLTVVAAIAAAILGPPLIPLVFGSEFDGSVNPFLLLLPGALGAAALVVFTNALVASSAPGLSSLGPLVSLCVGLTLDFALIPPFEASGAAGAASAAFLTGGATALLVYRSREGFRWRAVVLPRRGDLDVLRALIAALPLPALRRGSS